MLDTAGILSELINPLIVRAVRNILELNDTLFSPVNISKTNATLNNDTQINDTSKKEIQTYSNFA